MRPAKKILIASTFEMRTSLLRFTLTTHKYRVAVATSEAEAKAHLAAYGCDLVIVDLPFAGHASLLHHVDQFGWRTPVMALANREDLKGECGFDAFLPREYSPAELLDRLKVMAHRKRGPHKKMVARVAMAAERVVNF